MCLSTGKAAIFIGFSVSRILLPVAICVEFVDKFANANCFYYGVIAVSLSSKNVV